MGFAIRYWSSPNSLGVRRTSRPLRNHAPRCQVDLDIVKLNRLRAAFGRRRHAAQRGADARQQFRRAERLGDVIVGAGVERGHFILLGIAHRQHDDRDLGAGADGAARLQAAHPRHVHVEQNQVEAVRANGIQRLLAGARFVKFIAVPGQRGAQHAADLRLIVDHQNAAGTHFRRVLLVEQAGRRRIPNLRPARFQSTDRRRACAEFLARCTGPARCRARDAGSTAPRR